MKQLRFKIIDRGQEALDQLMSTGNYTNASEAINDALINLAIANRAKENNNNEDTEALQ